MTVLVNEETHVAIIGAGASGLAQLKQLIDAFSRPNVKSRLKVTVFEKRDQVGGVWYRQQGTKPYETSVGGDGQMYIYPPTGDDPSPMYDGLRTNLPYDLMSFRDLPMKSEEVFPDRETVQAYLEEYADTFDLRPKIRFRTSVTRLRQNPGPGRRWSLESRGPDGEEMVEEYDYVCVANGHYADPWIPNIPSLSSFPGQIVHSRFYARPEDYIGQTVMVVGSFASGSDLARQLANLNVSAEATNGHRTINGESSRPNTKVYQSSSQIDSSYSRPPGPGDAPQPWREHFMNVPLISHLDPPSEAHPNGQIHSQNDYPPIDDVDTIIFATGYNCFLPFCKAMDEPWCRVRPLEHVITPKERSKGNQGDIGGIKGLTMHELDDLLLFFKDDRSVAFPVLQYQIVPFPLAEVQTRLTALLWAGLLPNFPEHPQPPPNVSNPYANSSPDSEALGISPPKVNGGVPNGLPNGLANRHGSHEEKPKPNDAKPVRKVMQMRQKLVFGSPYEFEYQEYLMSLMLEVDGDATPDHWRRIEQFRHDRRADSALRRKLLGY